MAVAFWVFTWAAAFSVTEHGIRLFWTRMMMAGPGVIPAAFLYFALIFPKEEKPIPTWAFWLFFILPGSVLLALSPTGFSIREIKPAAWGIDFVPGIGNTIITLYFVVYLGIAFYFLARKFLASKGMDRERIRYIFLGAFIAVSIGFVVNLVLPMIGITRFNKFGPLATTIFIAFNAYAIVKTRVMDISVVISRTVAETLAIIFHGVVYTGLVIFYRAYVGTTIDLPFLALTVAYGVVVGQTHQSIRLFLQTTSDKLFIRGRYNYYRSLSDASSKVGRKLSLPDILKVLYDTFYEVVEIAEPRVFLPENFGEGERSSDRYIIYGKQDYAPLQNSPVVANDSELVKKLLAAREPLADVREIDAALVVPCLLEDRVIAFFALGPKMSEDHYTDEDLRLLKVLANQAAITLDHTRSYQRIKIDLEAAERQLERSQRLASLGTLTAGVTHEIRNPLTVIRAETERLTNELRDPAYLQQFRDLLLKHIDRISGIVERMLGLAKEKPKREEAVDLNELITSTLQLCAISRISVKSELGPIYPVKGDPEALQEIFVNLIQNAIEAMPEGGTLTLRSFNEDHRVVVEVGDTGKGIPEEIREKIFDPFYSTRHEGVGLGLSIVYRIVREHGGDIKVHSAVGKGSIFRLSFSAV
jgi:signal transduction histidine kinase